MKLIANNNQEMSNKKEIVLKQKIVGLFKKSNNFGFVIPDDRKIGMDIFISKSKWGKAKNNQKVVAEVIKCPERGRKAEGKIIEILGKIDESGVDMLSIIKQFNLPNEFPKKVLDEAKEVSKEKIEIKFDLENEEMLKNENGLPDDTIPHSNSDLANDTIPHSNNGLAYDKSNNCKIFENYKIGVDQKGIKRYDLRDEEIFTVDGEDAKDLDDAVNVKKCDDGNFLLGVHIADVSNYVREGSDLNREAITRGTSVYMLDRVIPMLPVELSNGCCSLNQHEDRYAISVIMKINNKGEVIDSDINKTIIRVTKRMNYHEVQAIIDRKNCNDVQESINRNVSNDEKNMAGAKDFNTKQSILIKNDEMYFEHFDRMNELAKILKKRRMNNGYLSLDIPETEIILSKKGEPIEIRPYETSFSNEIIEQFMLTANETVAEKFYWLNAPFIYRVHEKPDEEKVTDLNKSLYNFGYRIKGKKDDVKPKAFSDILEDVKGKDEEKVVSNLILRTLKIAKYEAENKGHFGIASKYYCHFTSPIRRYPDLFIHRVISKYLECNYNVGETFKEKFNTQAIKYSITSSETEQVATKAERESEKVKMCEYMEKHIGEEYDGIVSSITNFGMFVELPSTIEGLVHFADMGNEYFIYNESNKTLIGEKTGRVFKMGDKVRVKAIYASKMEKVIDFKLIDRDKNNNDDNEKTKSKNTKNKKRRLKKRKIKRDSSKK